MKIMQKTKTEEEIEQENFKVALANEYIMKFGGDRDKLLPIFEVHEENITIAGRDDKEKLQWKDPEEEDEMWVQQEGWEEKKKRELEVDQRLYNQTSMDNHFMDYQIRTLVQGRQEFLDKMAQDRRYHHHKFLQGLKGTSDDTINSLKSSVFR